MTTLLEIDEEKWVKVKILMDSHNNLIDRIDKLKEYFIETDMILKVIESHTSLREKLDKLEKSKDDMEKKMISSLEHIRKFSVDLFEPDDKNEEKTDDDIEEIREKLMVKIKLLNSRK
jgi:hypothetical protein